MKRQFIALVITIGAAGPAQAQLVDRTEQNLIFNPGQLATGTPTTWTVRTSTDNAVATLLVDSQGTTVGATPTGYSQLRIRAQDEVLGCLRPPCSSDLSAYVRVMSTQYNQNNGCVGTQCPTMTEVYSDGNVRLTAGGGRVADIVTGNRPRISIAGDGTITFPDLAFPADGSNRWLCVNSNGSIFSQATPCR